MAYWASASPKQPPTRTYTVETGDTLWSIALQVDPTRDPREVYQEIAKLNGLGSADIYPGEVLSVPIN